jgi:ABC-type glucose/galactose transport system permease subunit
METILVLLVLLAVVGIIAWLVGYIPMDSSIQQIIRGLLVIIAVALVVWWLLSLIGAAPPLRVPR